MNLESFVRLSVLCWLCAACAASPLPPPQPGTLAPDFALKDQYDVEHQLRQFRGRDVLLLVCDHNSLSEAEIWLHLLDEQYDEGLEVLPIADGSGLPFFAKWFFKGRIKNELHDPDTPSILLDWAGDVPESYGMSSVACFVVLIDRDGNVRFTQSLPTANETSQQMLLHRLDAYLLPETPHVP